MQSYVKQSTKFAAISGNKLPPFGKSGRYLESSNVHLFRFEECFQTLFVSIIMFLLQL